MNTLDVVVGAVIAVGLVRGYATGFFKQAGSIVGFVLAFIFAASLMRSVGIVISDSTGLSVDLAPLAGFLAVFLVVYLLVMLVAKFAEDAFGAMKLTAVNRAAGAAAGGVKAALLLSVVLMTLAYVGIPSVDARRSSGLYAPVSMLGPTVWSWVSDNADAFDELTKRLKIEIDRRARPVAVQ